jgi:hypothetical protein
MWSRRDGRVCSTFPRASKSFAALPGSAVNLRLEAVGDRLLVYVNDELRLEHAGDRALVDPTSAAQAPCELCRISSTNWPA